MRNRGTEIYMLSNEETPITNHYDIKSLIYKNGLHDPKLIHCLLQIHDFICNLIIGKSYKNSLEIVNMYTFRIIDH